MTAPSPEPRFSFPSVLDLRAAHRDLLKQQLQGTVDSKIVEDFVLRARMTGARLYRDTDREIAQSVIDYWIAALYRARVDLKEVTLEAFDETGVRRASESNPYLGLAPFTENDSARFFGRNALLGVLRSRILASERLLILIGQSGTGKSSIVRGGLIPRMKKGAVPGSENWRYLDPFVPGAEPLVNLARVMRPKEVVVQDDWIPKQVKKLLASPKHLHQTLTEPGHEPVFLVVDQFEEIFTLCADVQARRAFAANLVHLVTAPGPKHIVILTVRSDYEPHLMKLQDIASLVRQAEVRVGPMNDSELREVIERPAEMAGLLFDDGLVDSLIDEVRGEPAALPLLQFTLRKLWEGRDHKRHRVTWTEYERLNGAFGALSTAANELFDELTLPKRECVRRIFLRIIRTSPSSDSLGRNDRAGLETMSRRIRKSDAIAGEVTEEAEAVLQKLIDAGLLRISEGDSPAAVQVEVAHEALIRNWDRLRGWIDQERVQILDRDLLETAAQYWRSSGKQAGLLDEQQLRDARVWLKEADARAFDVSESVREFIEASDRQIEQAKALEEQRTRRVWTLWGSLIAVVIVTLVVALMYMMTRLQIAEEVAKRSKEEADQQVRARMTLFSAQAPDSQLRQSYEVQTRGLREENAHLRAQLHQLTAPVGDVPTPLIDAQKTTEKLIRELEDMRTNTRAKDAQIITLEKEREEFRAEAAHHRNETERYRASAALLEDKLSRLEAVPPPPPTPGLLKGVDLKLNDIVSSMHAEAQPAAICCFLKDKGSRYLVTTATAVHGEPGDVVVQHSEGKVHKIGTLWWRNETLGTGIVLLYPTVGTDEKIPAYSKGASRRAINRLTWFDDKDEKVRVIGKDGFVESIITAEISENEFEIAMSSADVQIGSAVINDRENLVGFVAGVTSHKATVKGLRPVLRTTKLGLEKE